MAAEARGVARRKRSWRWRRAPGLTRPWAGGKAQRRLYGFRGHNPSLTRVIIRVMGRAVTIETRGALMNRLASSELACSGIRADAAGRRRFHAAG